MEIGILSVVAKQGVAMADFARGHCQRNKFQFGCNYSPFCHKSNLKSLRKCPFWRQCLGKCCIAMACFAVATLKFLLTKFFTRKTNVQELFKECLVIIHTRSSRKWGKFGVTFVSMETRKLDISTKEVLYLVVERPLQIFNSKYIFTVKFFVLFYTILFL